MIYECHECLLLKESPGISGRSRGPLLRRSHAHRLFMCLKETVIISQTAYENCSSIIAEPPRKAP